MKGRREKTKGLLSYKFNCRGENQGNDNERQRHSLLSGLQNDSIQYDFILGGSNIHSTLTVIGEETNLIYFHDTIEFSQVTS